MKGSAKISFKRMMERGSVTSALKFNLLETGGQLRAGGTNRTGVGRNLQLWKGRESRKSI